jgi:hypothetical protein
MEKNIRILKWSLLPGVIYFLGVGIAHMAGIKIPLLYIYFNIPSYGYQDKIISFLSLGWAIFFLTAFINPEKNMHLIKSLVIAGFGAIIGLGVINLSTNFRGLAPTSNIFVFWIELLVLSFYLIWLCVFFWRAKNNNNK